MPVMIHLDPIFLERLDAAALSIARRMPTGVLPELDAMVMKVSSDKSSSNGEGDNSFQVGNVFKHKMFRYTGAIISVLSQKEREEHDLESTDRWYSALVDARYKKDNKDVIFVAEAQIERMYPGSKDGFIHPRRDELFSGFNPETSSFLSKKKQTADKKHKTKSTRARTSKPKGKRKQKRKRSDL